MLCTVNYCLNVQRACYVEIYKQNERLLHEGRNVDKKLKKENQNYSCRISAQ